MASSNAKLTQSPTTFFARPEDKGSNNVGVNSWLEGGNFHITINGDPIARVRPKVYNSLRLNADFIGGEDGLATMDELLARRFISIICWNSAKGEEEDEGDRFQLVIQSDRSGRVSKHKNALKLVHMLQNASDLTEDGESIGMFRTKVRASTKDPQDRYAIKFFNGFVLVDHEDDDVEEYPAAYDDAKARRKAARANKLQS